MNTQNDKDRENISNDELEASLDVSLELPLTEEITIIEAEEEGILFEESRETAEVEPAKEVTPAVPSISTPPSFSGFSNSGKITTVTPPLNSTYDPKVNGVRTYWGMTSILTSWVGFLIAQIIMAIVLVVYTLYADPAIITKLTDNPDPNALIASVPWFLIVGQLTMYFIWWASAWWVTAYRSGVQLGKKFITAWKDNFYFRFKPVDILLGLGIAALMFGLNFGISYGLPILFPNMDLSDAGNTQVFESLEGTAWYFIIAFGFGAFLGPITEELFFRGFMMKGLINHFGYAKVSRNIDDVEEGVAERMGWEASSFVMTLRVWTNKWKNVLALIITTIVFGLMHFQGAETFGQWLVVIVTALFGLILGMVTLKTQRISAAMIGHVAYNSSVFILLTLGLTS